MWFWVAVFLLGGGAALLLHWLEVVAMCVGALVIGIAGGWGWVKWRRLQGRPLFAPRQVAGQPYRQPVAQPQYQQALPQSRPVVVTVEEMRVLEQIERRMQGGR